MTDIATAVAAETESKRSRIADKVFINADGSESRHASINATRLEFRFKDGEVVPVVLTDFADNVQRAAAWHGLSQKLGDAYAGAADGNEAREGRDEKGGPAGLLTVLEILKAGEWLKDRESAGPRISVLFEAVVRVLTDTGQVVDDTRAASIREKIAGKVGREKAMANPQIAAAYEALRAERAAAKAKAAAAKAATAGPIGLDF